MTGIVATCDACQGDLERASNYLCSGCTEATRQRVAAFPYLYADLVEYLNPLASNWPRGNGGHATQAHAPMPLAEAPLILRGPGGIVGVLEDWRGALHADRGWSTPKGEGSIEDRIKAASHGLAVNMSWVAEQWPQAGDFAEEIRGLYRDITSITDPPERKGVRMGYCPAVYDGTPCGAVLRLPPGETTIRCATCEAEYPQRLWSWLRIVQDDLGEAS